MSGIELKLKAKGKCRVQVIDTITGETRVDTGVFSNTLLNNFFTLVAQYTGLPFGRCYASTDSVVDVTDTTLNSLGTSDSKVVTALPRVVNAGVTTAAKETVFTFTAGAIVGNLSCIGISVNTNMSTLIIKTLVKDVNGDPTTITVTATDQLIITHTLSIEAEQYPAPFELTIDGTVHSFQFMCSWVPALTDINGPEPFAIGYAGTGTGNTRLVVASAVTGFISGDVGSQSTRLTLTNYTAGTPWTVTKDTSQAAAGKVTTRLTTTMPANTNISGNADIKFIGSEYLYNNNYVYTGFEVTPALPKTASIAYTFTIAFTLSR